MKKIMILALILTTLLFSGCCRFNMFPFENKDVSNDCIEICNSYNLTYSQDQTSVCSYVYTCRCETQEKLISVIKG